MLSRMGCGVLSFHRKREERLQLIKMNTLGSSQGLTRNPASNRSLLRSRPSVQLPLRHLVARQRRALVVRAEEGNGAEPGPGKEKGGASKLVKGLDKGTAQKILSVWKESGATDPESLRKLLLKRSVASLGAILLQTGLDAGASWAAITTAQSLGAGGDFFGKIAVEYLAYFLGIYFAVGAVLDLFFLGATVFAGVQYSTNAEAFMAAVQQVAGSGGPAKGLAIADKAQAAVNTLKVIDALNKISDLLKEQAASGRGAGGSSTLKSLSSFLTLAKAAEMGFKPSDYGLSDEQAGNIATVFAQYDLNDDMSLELLELRRLFQEEGFDFAEAEVKEALKILDKSGDGLISFPEFVEWWVNKVDAPQTPTAT